MREVSFRKLQALEVPMPEPEPNPNQGKIDSLISIRDTIQAQGVSISMMELVESVAPEAMPENLPLNTFTTDYSQVNKDEVLDSIDATIKTLE